MKAKLYFTLTLITFVTLAFVLNSFAQDDSPEYVVRVIYFIPNGQEPDSTMDGKLDILIKDMQKFYADQMEAHGFGRKTFKFEADHHGNAVVHHINGKFNEDYYYQTVSEVRNEIAEQFDMSRNIYFIALDTNRGLREGSGIAWPNDFGGSALVPASRPSAATHELGHTFGLRHSFNPNDKLIFTNSRNTDKMLTSFCAARLLDKSRYFNLSHGPYNKNTSMQMFTPNLADSPYAIHLRFEITDPDGLYQAQLVKPFGDYAGVIACKQLDGKKTLVEFVTTDLIGGNFITLRVMDKHGNITSETFPIDVTALLPSPEAISIPDTELTSVVRERLSLSPSAIITQLDMLRLTRLGARNRNITNLIGLEHAANLLSLGLRQTKISDVAPLAELTNLQYLNLSHNSISDVTPLANLTRLKELLLDGNQISDVSPLAELTNLEILWNPIKNRKPLFALLRKNPNLKIHLEYGKDPLPVTLSHFQAKHTDAGIILKWTTESEVNNAGFYIYRSERKNGEFKVINPQLIQGAGTTGERNEYTWTDSTAKPNTAYYYRIADVSYAGVREQLATVRLRGLVSTTGKLLTRWSDLKRTSTF